MAVIRKLRSCGKVVYSVLFVLYLCETSSLLGVCGAPEYIANFGNFTDQLVHILETSEPTEHRPGVHLYTPFTIGYLLANIYENLWPVPVRDVPEAIFTLKRYVATDYAALLRLFKKRQFRVSSTIFSRYGNITKPPTFPQLLTQVIALDLQKNRTQFRTNIKEILERGTKGHLDNEMLPKKDAAWREIFDRTTHGVYVNTLHYKSEWDKPWKSIGEMKFFDGATVPFIELQGKYPYAETENASAVIIKFQASTKQVVLFKPHDFSSVTDMRRIVRDMLNNKNLWKIRNVTIQMPALNVTNLSQPSDKFPFVGVVDTFCRGRHMNHSEHYFNQHPIAHANHFEFSTNFVEISSSSGSLVAYQNNKDFLPKPPANKSQHESGSTNDVDYFDILEASEDEDEQFQDYIVDARSGIPQRKKRFRGDFRRVNLYQRSDNESDIEECDAISALIPIPTEDTAGKKVVEEGNEGENTSTPLTANTTEIPSASPSSSSSSISIESNISNDVTMSEEEAATTFAPMSSTPTSSMSPDNENKTLVFDTPFSWILRDTEIGEVFYGSVSSLCQYKRAVQHIPTVPVWVLDLFKAFYWRCV